MLKEATFQDFEIYITLCDLVCNTVCAEGVVVVQILVKE